MEEKIICNKKTLVDIANAIREVIGSTDEYYPYELADLIKNLKPSEPEVPNTFSEISSIVNQGKADLYFNVGDQINTKYTNKGTIYENPFDIVQIECNPILESGEMTHGMMLQQHYATIEGCPFDAQEALYDAEEELPAGTYHFTIANNAFLKSENGKIVQFTLTQPIPAGGQIVFATENGYELELAGQNISTYRSATSMSVIETVVLSEGNAGIDLGITNGQGNLNDFCRAFLGNNSYKYSMLRQYLNSDKSAGNWWTKQHKWDRSNWFPRNNDGFLCGVDPEFLSIIKPVKIQILRDNVMSNSEIDVIYDKFFPISLEQINSIPEIEGVEGSALEYWINMAQTSGDENLDSNGRFIKHRTHPILQVFVLNNQTVSKNYFLISVNGETTSHVMYITNTGMINSCNANSWHRCNPACVI